MNVFKCVGYKEHPCGKEVKRTGRHQKYCSACAKAVIALAQANWRNSPEGRAYRQSDACRKSIAAYQASSEYRARIDAYQKSPRGKATTAAYHSSPEYKLIVAAYRVSPAGLAACAKTRVSKLLKRLKLSKNYDVRGLVLNRKISNRMLEEITRGAGWPDFREEALEEKRRGDYLSESQWARAILEYRLNRKYRVAWRFTSARRKIFTTVFDFYDWQLKQKENQ
jgi:hypothetical protein